MVQKARNITLPAIKLVVFDCDGVLIDSERPSCRATARFARSHGINISDEEAYHLFAGKASPQIAQELEAMAPGKLPADTAMQLRQGLIRLMEQEAESVDGAMDLLKALKELGVTVSVGSNSSQKEMEIKFSRTGMDKLLERKRIHSATDRNCPKPSPEIYLHAAEVEGVKPENTLVVEDSDTGAEAARRAGMSCLLLRHEGERMPPFWPVKNFVQVTHLSEVLPLIRPFLRLEEDRAGHREEG